MSTNHTPNFNLCQWEAADKVLRDDFNQDNAKIDAALRDMRPYLLHSFTTEADTESVDFDISGIEWNQYRWVIFEAIMSNMAFIELNVNGSAWCSHGSGAVSGAMMQSHFDTDLFYMFCPVFYRDNTPLRGFYVGGSGGTGISRLPCRQLTTITLSIQGQASYPRYIGAGTKFSIFGLK